MRINQRRGTRLLALSAITALALTACGGGAIEEETQANEEQQSEMGDCGEINMAVNPWVGYYADAYVVGHIAEKELGCTVNYKALKEGYKGSYAFRDKIDIEGVDHPKRMFDLTEGLIRRGYDDAEITGILGGNFRRVLSEIWSVPPREPKTNGNR